MLNKVIWGLGVLCVLLIAFFSVVITKEQRELKQMSEETKAYKIRSQKEKEPDHEHVHVDNGTRAGMSDSEQGTESTVEPNNPVNINESGNMAETTETVAIGTESEGPLRYKEGIYKGLTYFEAVAVWGEKLNKPQLKKNKIVKKIFELDDIWNTYLDESKSLSLSFLKLIPSDQLEKAKGIVLKAEPYKSDNIESFFNKINNAETKTLESIKIDAQFLQVLSDINKEERKQAAQESEKLDREIDKIFSEIPTLLIKEDM